MVFENLTLFEIQLAEAQFGPKTMRGDEPMDEPVDVTAHAESASRGKLVGFLAFALLTAGVAMLVRRSRSTDVELEADRDDAESDLAAAQ